MEHLTHIERLALGGRTLICIDPLNDESKRAYVDLDSIVAVQLDDES